MSAELKHHDISPALLRQRRNLLVVSLIILFMATAGAKLGAISLLGIQMTFEDPHAIVLFLKTFLLYFLYRYYLYIIQEPDLLLKSTFYARLNALTWKKIQEIKDREFPSAVGYGGEYDFRKMERVGFVRRKVNAVLAKDGEGGLVQGSFEIDASMFVFDAVRAAIYTLLNRSYATDYLLPFALAFAALGIGTGSIGS